MKQATENKLTASEETRKKSEVKGLGIALSGGGARGFAHLGALKALEEDGVKPDIIAGVSAGSVVAVLYASGLSVEKIMTLFNKRHFKDFCEFNFSFNKSSGFFCLDRFRECLREWISPYEKLEDLPIPTFLGVTDFSNGCQAEFHSGEIAPRVVASCSIPICFEPVVIDGVTYVDGGVVRNMPSWIIRDKCRRLVGVNCSPVLKQGKSDALFQTAMRTYNLLAKANQKEDQALCDLAVEIPEIASYQVFNLKDINKVFISGYATMRRAIKRCEWWADFKSELKSET